MEGRQEGLVSHTKKMKKSYNILVKYSEIPLKFIDLVGGDIIKVSLK
jgi:hypothetical protein